MVVLLLCCAVTTRPGVPAGGAAAVAADSVRAAHPRVLYPSRGRGVPMGRMKGAKGIRCWWFGVAVELVEGNNSFETNPQISTFTKSVKVSLR